MTRQEAEASAADQLEAHRHRCEVRSVARMVSNNERADYLSKVGRERGTEAAWRLRRDVWEEIKKGMK